MSALISHFFFLAGSTIDLDGSWSVDDLGGPGSVDDLDDPGSLPAALVISDTTVVLGSIAFSGLSTKYIFN